MKNIKSFFVDVLEYLSYYLIIGFIEWNFEIQHWSPWSRLAFIALVIYSVGKQLNEEKE